MYLGTAVGEPDNYHLGPVLKACPEMLRRDHGDAGQDAGEVWLLPGQKARGVCVYPGQTISLFSRKMIGYPVAMFTADRIK
jgi:hypothetical protein